MKIKFLTVITSLLTAAFMITSCLDDNEVETEYSSDSSITAFSIENIETRYNDSIRYGKDTTVVATVTGKNYPFVIDQVRGQIYNVDSLPAGTDVKKVVVEITADTPYIFIVAETDSLWTSTDSLNFENPIKFKVMALSGVYGKEYEAKINVHKQVPDSLQWTHISSSFNTGIAAQKAVTLDDRIYVFANQGSKVALTSTSINDGKSWTELQTLNLPDNADYSSAMAWGSNLYILAGEELYRSSDGSEWSKVNTDAKFSRLIANVHSDHNNKLYAANADNHFMESADGIAWNVNEEVPAEFPKTHISYTASPLGTNSLIERMTVMGDNGIAADTAAIVWTKLTTETTWGDYPISAKESRYCPKLANIAMIYYNEKLYAFGGPGKSNGKAIPAFSRFYESKNQGVTWSPVSQYVFFPESFTGLYNQAAGNYSFVVDKNNFLWIIWSKTGQVWRGRINKMGFDKKE